MFWNWNNCRFFYFGRFQLKGQTNESETDTWMLIIDWRFAASLLRFWTLVRNKSRRLSLPGFAISFSSSSFFETLRDLIPRRISNGFPILSASGLWLLLLLLLSMRFLSTSLAQYSAVVSFFLLLLGFTQLGKFWRKWSDGYWLRD